MIERAVVLGEGEAALHGSLILPAGDGPAPAVLILAGSGPVDRDGNLPGLRNDSLRLLARGLSEQGIVTLRFDKRGIGASQAAGPAEAALRLDSYVADSIAWAARLRAEPRVRRLFWLGHSEGALVATLAAQRMEAAGLVLLAGAGMPAGQMLARQLASAGLAPPLLEAAQRILSALERGENVPDIPAELWALFRPSAQPYLASWLPLDPAAELARLSIPVLLVQGSTDLQVGLADAGRLHAARPDARLLQVEGMNHVLRQAPAERGANLATYAAFGLPLAPGLVEGIAAFMRR